MHWSEFQDSAERLCNGTTEGDWRSAVSRSYYAVFHCYRTFLSTHGVDLGTSGQSHFNLYAGLLHCGFPEMARIASKIDQLRARRARADYELLTRVSQAAARSATQSLRLLVADLSQILTTLPASTIAAGAKRYLQSIGRLPKSP